MRGTTLIKRCLFDTFGWLYRGKCDERVWGREVRGIVTQNVNGLVSCTSWELVVILQEYKHLVYIPLTIGVVFAGMRWRPSHFHIQLMC